MNVNQTTPRLSADSVALEEIPENAIRILGAAVQLFAEKGYSATSVREIVQLADVTNPMLYYYFDSKEGLFRFLTNFMHAEFRRSIMSAIDPSHSLEESLTAVVDIHFEGLRESADALRFVYAIMFGPKGSAPEHQIHENHEMVVNALESAFRNAEERGRFRPNPEFDHRWRALNLLGLANSHVMRVLQEVDRLSADEQEEFLEREASTEKAKALVRFFLNGAGEISS